jgi:protoporphyrinogen oxidase
MDDPYLRPPLMYYYRYLELAMKPTLSMVVGGTQTIWAKVAATYPSQSIRLNERVLSVRRTPEAVSVRTAKGTETYDYVIIGTSLKDAQHYLDVSPKQKEFMNRMKYNHYPTVLCRVSGLNAVSSFNISACLDIKQLGRIVYCSQQHADSDVTTLNLYIDPKRGKVDDKTIIDEVETSLREDFGAELLEKDKAQVFRWDDYFGHLSEQDIRGGWYEKFERDIQGKDRTLFLSSGLRMETMGASVQYATTQTKKYARGWLKQV